MSSSELPPNLDRSSLREKPDMGPEEGSASERRSEEVRWRCGKRSSSRREGCRVAGRRRTRPTELPGSLARISRNAWALDGARQRPGLGPSRFRPRRARPFFGPFCGRLRPRASHAGPCSPEPIRPRPSSRVEASRDRSRRPAHQRDHRKRVVSKSPRAFGAALCSPQSWPAALAAGSACDGSWGRFDSS